MAYQIPAAVPIMITAALSRKMVFRIFMAFRILPGFSFENSQTICADYNMFSVRNKRGNRKRQ